jgi:transcriptional repressor NrdR
MVTKEGPPMRCPYCRHGDSRVVDSREAEDGQIIRRRRACPECGRRFTTVEEAVLAVVKRSGVTEPFSRSKIIAGVRKACQGRPVDEDAIAVLAQKVEETVRARGAAEIPSHEVGLAILGPLRHLDEVAYLRFASVYRSFDSLGDFEREIAALRAASAASEPEHGPASARQAEREHAGGRQAEQGHASGRQAEREGKSTEPADAALTPAAATRGSAS